jgi:hypothetical protein
MALSIRHTLLPLIVLIVGAFGQPKAISAEPDAETSTQAPSTEAADEAEKPAPEARQRPPAVELSPVRAKYSAKLEKGIPFRGSATRSLKQRDDGLWLYRFNVDSFIADIRESLLLKWDGHQVIPIEYNYKLSGLMVPDRSAQLDFDWNKFRVLNDVKDQPWYMDIHTGVLDKLGFQLQLRQDLKAGKTRMIYEIADGGKLKEYEFKVIGEEVIDTDNHGRVNTVLVEKVREPYKERETHLWFAPEWDYLLVKMVQIEDDGTRYEINLDEAVLPGRRIE